MDSAYSMALMTSPSLTALFYWTKVPNGYPRQLNQPHSKTFVVSDSTKTCCGTVVSPVLPEVVQYGTFLASFCFYSNHLSFLGCGAPRDHAAIFLLYCQSRESWTTWLSIHMCCCFLFYPLSTPSNFIASPSVGCICTPLSSGTFSCLGWIWSLLCFQSSRQEKVCVPWTASF